MPKDYNLNSCPFEPDQDIQDDLNPLKQDPNGKNNETTSIKAAKKALKKAKRKAKKLFEVVSPMRSPCNGSPR